MSSTGKRFAEEFRQIGEVKLEDKVLIQDSADGLVKYALVDQFNAAAHKEFEDFLKGEDADEIINKWSELEKFLAGLKEADDLATILSEKFNTKDFTKEKIKETLGIYDWALAETPPSGTGADFPLTYDAERDTWELKGNLVITKGLATYTKLAGFTNLDVMGGIKVDRTSIYINDNGELAVVGGAGGGLDESALADYLTTNKYATQTWVTNQKYFTQANFTKDKIKEALGISDWALAASKPSYAWSEITSKPSYIFYSKNAIINPTDTTFRNMSGYAYSTDGGGTTGVWASFYSNNYIAQMQFNYSSAIPFVRVYDYSSSAWSDWKRIALHSTFDNYVPLATAKDITAIHNFVNGVKIGGKQITYDSAKNAIILPTNVVIEGGLATYSTLNEDDVLSEFDGLPIDGTTIYWSVDADGNKILKAAGGGGSGEGGGLSIEDVKGYLEGNSYIRQQDLDSAGYITGDNLAGYALKSDLNAVSTKLNNFLEGSDTDAIINKWSELEVFLSGLTETENLVTILTTKFNTADFTKANIKDKLGIADWALSTTNPSYTKAEADNKYLLKTGTAADSSKLGGTDATYFARWADHVVASSSYKHLGYGYSSDGWHTTGPATVFGVSNYKAALQFSWTDSHFYAGYGYETDELSNWKKLAYITDTVDAAKKLLSNSKSVYYDSAKDAWVVEGNLVITKGLATYTRLEGFEDFGIMDAIEVDGTTISKDGGVLHFIGETGGLDETQLEDYLTSNGYATQTWVTNKGYALQSSLTDVDNRLKSVETFFATDDTDSYVNKWDEIVTFLNAVEGDTLDNILSTKFNTADFTKSNIKSTLGISDWALAASKPSYAWSEITSKPSYIFYSKNAIINPTDTTFRNMSGYAYSTDGGGTTGVWTSFYSNNYIAQMQFNYSSAIPFVRVYDHSASAWSDWKRIALHSTFDNYLALAGGTMKGTLISQAVRPSANDSYSLGTSSYRYSTMYGQTLDLGGATLTYNLPKKAWQLEGNLIVTGGLATYSTLTGVDLEEYLTTAGGTIEGDLGVTGRITVQNHLLAEHSSNPWLGLSRAGVNWFVQVTSKGILLGKTSATSITVDASGNLAAVGAVTENSDRKLKDVEYEGDGLGLDVLKKVKVAKWHWKDKRDKRLHIGGVADNIAEVMPEVVFESQEEDGTTTSSIAYGKAGFSIAASLIAPVARHEDRIKELEKNIEQMQKELNKLKKSA